MTSIERFEELAEHLDLEEVDIELYHSASKVYIAKGVSTVRYLIEVVGNAVTFELDLRDESEIKTISDVHYMGDRNQDTLPFLVYVENPFRA